VEREEILSRLNRPQGVCLATVDRGEPRVRGIQLYAVDERGVLFQTGPMKAMHKELLAHPMAELCFIDPKDFLQIRVRGEFAASTDEALKREIVDHPSRVYLNPWRERVGDETFFAQITVFQMRKATAQVWTMETNFSPAPAVDLY
jgi:pyridoxamine 5'-phosphate oxidase